MSEPGYPRASPCGRQVGLLLAVRVEPDEHDPVGLVVSPITETFDLRLQKSVVRKANTSHHRDEKL